MSEGGESKIFFCYLRVASFPSVFLQATWYSLVRVKGLYMIMPIVVDFLEVDATLGDGYGI